MSDVVIRVEGLGKRYLIGHQAAGERYAALRDAMAKTARGLARSARDMMRGRPIIAGDSIEEFWALRDVNFEIRRGDVVGIIGRNGAGKSTLLKILSRITEPSAGRATIRGRVASLLEVGAGFHPELTGRENIYLNGAILGMYHAEIRRKFDEIVDFAGVETFLDTPVKRYSSGMYLRLAFAVAAHLEADILVIDEVLAVGDAEFQKKCLGKMNDVTATDQKTILLVSHNMDAVLSHCKTGVLLSSGTVAMTGDAPSLVEKYLASQGASGNAVDLRESFRPQRISGAVQATRLWLDDDRGSWTFAFAEAIGFNLSVMALGPRRKLVIWFALFSTRGFEVATWSNVSSGIDLGLARGSNVFHLNCDGLVLMPGHYFLHVGIDTEFGQEDCAPEAVHFEIVANVRFLEAGARSFRGVVVPKVDFRRAGVE